jgi:autotransporter passenger strand-loop-strand repeat protein
MVAFVYSGQVDYGAMVFTTVSSRGELDVFAGGTTIGAVLSGIQDPVFSGQLDQGEEVVYGGTAIDTTVDFAGYLDDEGGVVSNTTINSGGFLLGDGTVVINTTINSGGYDNIDFGTAFGTILNSGGFEYVGSAAATIFPYINAFEYVAGVVSSATVDSAGFLIIGSGGAASGTTIMAGGGAPGGYIAGFSLGGGGLLGIASGGIAVNTTIISGGQNEVYGAASATAVSSGALQEVESSGIASGTTIYAGGIELIESGGTALGTTISGGTLVLSSGAVASGPVDFVGSGGTSRLTIRQCRRS